MAGSERDGVERTPRWWIRASWPRLVGDEPVYAFEIGGALVPWRFEATVVRDDERGDFDRGPFRADAPLITMQIEVEGDRPVVRELTISCAPGRFGESGGEEPESEIRGPVRPTAVTASLLREIPIARLAKYALLGAALQIDGGIASEGVVPGELRNDLGYYRVGPNEVDDDYGIFYADLQGWQDLWSEHMEALATLTERAARPPRRRRVSDELVERVAKTYRHAIATARPPKRAVMASEHVSEATAGRYIMRARERGYLGKTVRGKKGEIDSQETDTGQPAPD